MAISRETPPETLPELSIAIDQVCFVVVKARALTAFLKALDQDARLDLLTLAWIGRGDGSIADWDDVRLEAARAYTADSFVGYLLGMPLLADHLEEGLGQLGRSCSEITDSL